jgi:RNA polymerase sigma factor (sigma-70 family)
MADDFELLREHVERGSEEAFRTLVERHARMVYGTALRVLGNASAAEEVTQAVFILLARKGASIRRGTVLAGWLYRTAQFVARESLRAEERRNMRHERLAEMKDSNDSVWPKIAPVLDEAMGTLGTADRDAVVLRFFEGRSFAEIANALRITEPAAKMRVARALEKLRAFLAREQITVPAAILAATLENHSTPAASDAFVSSISSTALTETAVSRESLTALVKGALKIMAWNKVRNTALIAVLFLLCGGTVGFVAWKSTRASSPVVAISTFEPMAGEWEGTFEMSGDGFAEPFKQAANLSIKSIQGGRACQIEMRVLRPDGTMANIYRFTHSLNDAGDRIITLDDPNIARPLGEGVVTTSANDSRTGEWRAGFHAAIPNGGGSTDCEWLRRGNELIITRRDKTTTPQGASEIISELRLQRFGTTARL